MDQRTDQKPGQVDDEPLDFDKAPGAPDEPPPDDVFQYTLSKPIQAHGDELTVLHWREPTGGDIERAGNPVYLDFSEGAATVAINEKKMAGMISVLCQIPPSSVRQMAARDWNAVAWRLIRFFAPQGA